jgi:hypothetical protein
MSVLISDIRYYGSANMPEADSATVGGAIDFTKRVEFGTVTTATQYDLVSSASADTAVQLIFSGRDSTGVIHTETLNTNGTAGTTKVLSANTYERLLSGVTSGATAAFGLSAPTGTRATGDIALMAHTLTISAHTMQAGSANATTSNPPVAKLQSGDGASVAVGMVLRTTGGTGPNQIRRILAINPNGLGADVVAVDRNWGTTPDATTTYEVAPGFHFELTGSNGGVALTGTTTQITGITRLFVGTSADVSGGASRSYYEKIFVNNNNQATALTSAQIEIASDSPALPSGGALDIGLSAGLNDVATIANRQTAPASVTFTTQPALISVPAPGNLPASTAAGNAAGAQAIWVRLNLAAGTAAYEGSPGATFQTQGSST